MGATLFHDLAPEAIERARAIPWRQYLHRIATETEKFLRGARQAMSAVDQMSDTLVRKIRRVGQQAAASHEKAVAQLEQEREERQAEPDLDAVDFDDPEQLRQEEQRLIVAIAQNPKDATLYSDLAKVAMRLGNHGDAVEAMEQAVKLEPENDQYRKRLERAKRKHAEAETTKSS